MSDPPTAEPLLDLRGLVAGVLWRWRLLAALALLGVLAGGLLTFMMPPKPTAVTRVLVAHQGEGANADSLADTDVALFNTTATAGAAVEKLGLQAPPEDFLHSFKGKSLTPRVLKITAHGPTNDAAVRRAKVLAEVFISRHVERARTSARAQARALRQQRKQLQHQLAKLNERAASASEQDAGVLPQRRAGLVSQIEQLKSRAQELLAGVAPIAAGTKIVDPPRAVPTSVIKTGVMNTGVGLVFGFAAGVFLAAVACVVRDRPVLRRDVAAHLGTSVIVELPVARRGRLRGGGRRAREQRRAAATLARVVGDAPAMMSLLEIGCPRTASALALAMAGELDPDGLDSNGGVTVVDGLTGGHLERAAGERVSVVDVADLPARDPADSRGPRLGVGSAGPGTSWLRLDRLGTRALLVVRAGHASSSWLHTVARRLAHGGVTPVGVVLTGPYPWDGTDGTLWDNLHAVLRRHREPDHLRRAPDDGPPSQHRNGSGATGPDSPTEEMRLP